MTEKEQIVIQGLKLLACSVIAQAVRDMKNKNKATAFTHKASATRFIESDALDFYCAFIKRHPDEIRRKIRLSPKKSFRAHVRGRTCR